MPGIKIRTAAQFKDDREHSRFLLEPQHERQAAEVWRALEVVWREGHWTVNIDELGYIDEMLPASVVQSINKLLTQGRSKDITVVTGMQRPVGATRYAMSQATHLLAFQPEGRDLKTYREIGNNLWAETIESLQRFEFAWYYRPDRTVWRGTVHDIVEDPQGVPKRRKVKGLTGGSI